MAGHTDYLSEKYLVSDPYHYVRYGNNNCTVHTVSCN